MPQNDVLPTWRVIVPEGILIRGQAGLNGKIIAKLPGGSQFVQTGPLVEADNFIWSPHKKGFSAVGEKDGRQFAVVTNTSAVRHQKGSGVHLDPRNAEVNGKPSVEALGNIEWVRINYDVSFEQGRTDINAAFQLYEPIVRPYLEAGKQVIFVLSHETFGENTQGLKVFRPREFAPFVATIVGQWKTWNHQIVWEIWNEPDVAFAEPNFDPNAPHASVPLTPSEFADLITRTVRSIRTDDPNAVLISGGLMKGNPNYLKEMLDNLPQDVRLDGVGIHPYGQDPGGDPRFGPFGNLKSLMRGYKVHADTRRIPLYITEWGVLDRPNDPIEDVANYARRFLDASSRLAETAIWFAWADRIHNGYGLVDDHENKKNPLFGVFAQ